MTIRDLRQKEYASLFMNSGKRGILYLAVRLGKTRIGLDILSNYMGMDALVCYPENNIKDAWMDEAAVMGMQLKNVTFCNFSSLHTLKNRKFGIIIIDEVHDLSDGQIASLRTITSNITLGLTGTLSPKSISRLRNKLKLRILAEYSIEQAISDGIIADYEIRVHKVKLDGSILNNYNGKYKTEKRRFDDFSYVIGQLEEKGKDSKFMRLNRMRVLQSSVAKTMYTKLLLQKYIDERVLVFCALAKVADSLGIPTEHSKNASGEIQRFKNGIGNNLAVVDMASMGVTLKPLNRVIVNYITSNSEDMHQRIARALNLEYSGEVAHIDVICSTEEVELQWLKKALKLFDNSKIYYL